MFTGIVQGMAPVVAIDEKNNFRTHVVQFPAEMLPGLAPGASVANNGVCLTVSHIAGDKVSFSMMQETLCVTNLRELTVGNWINLERAAKFNSEIGGHLMSGHVITTAEIVRILNTENYRQLWFQPVIPGLMKYVLKKGFIGVDGVSLTVGEVAKNRFSVHLIPETMQRTTLGKTQLANRVNIEIDAQTQAIVDTVERVLAQQGRREEYI